MRPGGGGSSKKSQKLGLEFLILYQNQLLDLEKVVYFQRYSHGNLRSVILEALGPQNAHSNNSVTERNFEVKNFFGPVLFCALGGGGPPKNSKNWV